MCFSIKWDLVIVHDHNTESCETRVFSNLGAKYGLSRSESIWQENLTEMKLLSWFDPLKNICAFCCQNINVFD